MSTMRITEDHEWIRLEDGAVGITEFAQEQLGDIVFVELPQVGRKLKKDEEAVVIESVKAAAGCKAPVAGTVLEVNALLAEAPATINQDPTGKGWLFKLKIDDPEELKALLDEATYRARLSK